MDHDAASYVLPFSQIEAAFERIRHLVEETPLTKDVDSGIWLKCENEQTTGSFKLRGALAKLSLLPTGSQVVTASTGNHGLGVAKAATMFGHELKVFLPATASPKKIEKLKAQGVHIEHVQGDSLAAELAGKDFARVNQQIWVSPYNDIDVISGQGTIAVEILNQIKQVDKIYITVGGGGLISGIASYIKQLSPQTEIIGCQPQNSPEMYLSQLAGHVVMAPEELPTLSDGSAGPLEEDSITFPMCHVLVDRFILVNEGEIKNAIRYINTAHGKVIEGAAGVAFTAAHKDAERKTTDQVVVVLCGGNIDPVIHQQICNPT